MEPYTLEEADLRRLARLLEVSESMVREAIGWMRHEDTVAAKVETCAAFVWVGQSFKYCDNCGRPYWEHTHTRGTGINFGMLIPITEQDAEACRRKWENT